MVVNSHYHLLGSLNGSLRNGKWCMKKDAIVIWINVCRGDVFAREEAKALRLSFRFDVLYSCNMFGVRKDQKINIDLEEVKDSSFYPFSK